MCPRTYVHKYRAQGRPLQPQTGDEGNEGNEGNDGRRRERGGTTGDEGNEENGEKRQKNAKAKEKAKAVSEAYALLPNIYVFVGFATKHIYITRLCFFPSA